MGKNFSEVVRQADALMTAGSTGEARHILQQTIEQNPQDRGTYADAVAILISGGFFAEAKSLFQRYSDATGKSLAGAGGSEYTLHDIESMAEKAAKATIGEGDGVSFKAYPIISFRDGGVGLNLWSVISGITELVLYPEYLEITQRSRKVAFPWNELTAEVVTNKSGPRRIPINHITLHAPNRLIRLKTVPNAPQYFENEGKLLPELQKHLHFKT